ncbi:MAG: hypothetical protein LQ352_004385 [Teloschistes flavicans]|nr:MAG: hypothetical protein LQ352_004385 [Teloschistes flavicans]
MNGLPPPSSSSSSSSLPDEDKNGNTISASKLSVCLPKKFRFTRTSNPPMSSCPPLFVRVADSDRRMSPAQVPQVGFLFTLFNMPQQSHNALQQKEEEEEEEEEERERHKAILHKPPQPFQQPTPLRHQRNARALPARYHQPVAPLQLLQRAHFHHLPQRPHLPPFLRYMLDRRMQNSPLQQSYMLEERALEREHADGDVGDRSDSSIDCLSAGTSFARMDQKKLRDLWPMLSALPRSSEEEQKPLGIYRSR